MIRGHQSIPLRTRQTWPMGPKSVGPGGRETTGYKCSHGYLQYFHLEGVHPPYVGVEDQKVNSLPVLSVLVY